MTNGIFKGGKFSGRYSDCLRSLLYDLGAKQVLFEDFEDGYSGHIDVDVLLKDNRIFSYRYDYGSCSGCDEWESRGISEYEENYFEMVKNIMKTEATFFDDFTDYDIWKDRAKARIKKEDHNV